MDIYLQPLVSFGNWFFDINLSLIQSVVDKTGGGKLGKTIVEKILAKAAGKQEVSPGEYVEVRMNDYIRVSSDGGGTPSVTKTITEFDNDK